jgi:hypothetical protein
MAKKKSPKRRTLIMEITYDTKMKIGSKVDFKWQFNEADGFEGSNEWRESVPKALFVAFTSSIMWHKIMINLEDVISEYDSKSLKQYLKQNGNHN